MRLHTLLFGLFALVVASSNVQAQQNTGNISGQDGQSENFAIQRDVGAFIGGAATGLLSGQQGGNTTNALGRTGGNSLFGGLGGFGRGNTGFGNQGNQQTAEPQIRFRITLGFSHPRPSAAKVRSVFSERLTRIPQLQSAGDVTVSMEERTVVLAGQVESEHQKTLIGKLAMMEPGVSAVRNELTVAAPPEVLPLPEAAN